MTRKHSTKPNKAGSAEKTVKDIRSEASLLKEALAKKVLKKLFVS